METLASRIERAGALRDIDAVGWVIRLAKRVEGLHTRSCVHGSLSGHSMVIEGDACTSRGQLAAVQQPLVLATHHSPERLAGQGPSLSDDTWALAVTLYEALSGSIPFQAITAREMLAKIAAGPRPLAVFDVGDDELQLILDRALAREPSQRLMSVAQLRRALEAWGPVARLGTLPPLEDADLEDDDDDDDEFDPDAVTMVRGDIGPLLQDMLKTSSASKPSAPGGSAPAMPPPSTPGGSAPVIPPPSAPRGLAPAIPPPSKPGGSAPVIPPPSVPRGLAPAIPPPSTPRGAAPAIPPPSTPRGSVPGIAPPSATRSSSPGIAPPSTTRSSAPATPSPPAPRRFGPTTPAPSAPPPASVPPPGRKAPLKGLSTLGLRPTVASTRAPGSATSAPPPPLSEPPSKPKPELKLKPPPMPEPDALAMDLPPLLDEASTAPEPEDPLAMPGSWVNLDAPRRPPSGQPSAPRGEPAQAAAAAAPAVTAEPGPAPARVEPRPGQPAVAPRRRGRSWLIVVAIVVLVIGGIAAWRLTRADEPPPRSSPDVPAQNTAPSPPTAIAAQQAPAVATAAPEPSTEGPANAESRPTLKPATSAVQAPAVQDVTACMVPLFATGTFDEGSTPDFAFMCREVDPRRGISLIKKQVVLGDKDGTVSDGMREWALLGWYELAAYAMMHTRCCPAGPPLKLPDMPPPCTELGAVLTELGAMSVAAESPRDAELNKTLKRFTDEVYCLVRTGGTSLFGYVGPPKGGEDNAFRKTLARLVTKR